MKLSKKIILLSLLAGATIIIFYPQEEDIDIEEYWTTEKIVVNDTVIPFKRDIHIYGNQIVINEHNVFDNESYTFQRKGNDRIIICCKEENSLIKDSLNDLYKKEKSLEGNYKIKMSTEVIGGGKKAYYDIRLELVSKNKSISLYRTEPVKWEEGLQRGVP